MDHRCTDPVRAKDPLARDRAVRRSLSARGDFLLIGLSLIAGVAAVLLACFPMLVHQPQRVHLGELTTRLALPIGLFPLVFTLLTIGLVLTPMRASSERHWLTRLPFPFAHQGYFTTLRRDPSTNGLQLLLTFHQAPNPADVELLCKAKLRGCKLVWQDERCILVESPPKLRPRTGYRAGLYGNAALHRWFRKVAAPFLGDLYRRAGLKKVEVRT